MRLVLARAGETEPLERAHRRHVVLVGHSEHGTHTGLAQRPGDQRVGSLRREAPPPGSWNDPVADLDKTIGIRPAEEAGVADHLPGLALDEHPDPELLVAGPQYRLPREEI